MAVWTAAEAKAKFSELIDKARTDGPQHVTKNGREAVVVVSESDWRRSAPNPGSAADQLWPKSTRGLLENEEAERLFARDKSPGRKVEF